MTSAMYRNGEEMQVTNDPDGRAELARFGWTEKPIIKLSKTKAKRLAKQKTGAE